MYLLGIDLGTSSIKVSVVEIETQKCVASAQYPESETAITSIVPEWAEQSPIAWWNNTLHAVIKLNASKKFDPKKIKAIGIGYQMHGLVIVGKNQEPLRDAIIWCDSRAVELGNLAFEQIGEQKCLSTLLNSPGNFTASKLAWVKANEPHIYEKIDKAMLPGDFIAMKLTGEITTSISALSEGIFWDFKKNKLSDEVIGYYGLDRRMIPEVRELFAEHGRLSESNADFLGLTKGIPVSYKAGDQPNNALSLNVLNAGEVAATAGTSGVIYGVSDKLTYDRESRVNTFAHVNYREDDIKTGVLLCINGAGSMLRWAKHSFAPHLSYNEVNEIAGKAPIGSKGLRVLPFGNGAERMLKNRFTGAKFSGIDLNTHTPEHIFRAVQESIAFAFRYGLDIMKENGMQPKVIRAGKANLFQSELFSQTFVDLTNVPVELYHNNGSVGAALGAGIGAGFFSDPSDAFIHQKAIKQITPLYHDEYEPIYQEWKNLLEDNLKQKN